MTITFTEKLKAAGADAVSISLPKNPEAPGFSEALYIRHLSQSGEFVNAVRCYPGCLTVIQERGEGLLRQALLGNTTAGTLDLRAGNNELHRSEIYVVDSGESLMKELTVKQALKSAGAPDHEIDGLLKQAGLEAVADKSPRDIGTQSLKALGIAASMYARARLLLYDRPFVGADPAWIDRICRLMLQIGELNARALILTGETQIPELLKSSPRVLLQDPRNTQQSSVSIPNRENTNGVSAVSQTAAARELIQASVAQPQIRVEPLITRPQTIYVLPRMNQQESLHSEAIPNATAELQEQLRTLGGGAGASQLRVEAQESSRKEGVHLDIAEKESFDPDVLHNEYSRLKTPNALTRVGYLQRVKRTAAYRKVDERVRKMRSRMSARPNELDIPGAARMLHHTNKRKLKFRVIVAAVVVVCVGVMHWM